MLFSILCSLAMAPTHFWQMKSWGFRLLSNSVAYGVLSLNFWVLSTKLSFPPIFRLGLKCSFSSKNEIFFFFSMCIRKRRIQKSYDQIYVGLGTINVNLKELHKIVRPIPACPGKKTSLAWLRHVIWKWLWNTVLCRVHWKPTRKTCPHCALCRVLKVHIADDEAPLMN